uniref:Uncharacterized protein n=1 Tax=Romanomermis culicivorax TaxID=13658 RepID=A0A915JC43_ROMCU
MVTPDRASILGNLYAFRLFAYLLKSTREKVSMYPIMCSDFVASTIDCRGRYDRPYKASINITGLGTGKQRESSVKDYAQKDPRCGRRRQIALHDIKKLPRILDQNEKDGCLLNRFESILMQKVMTKKDIHQEIYDMIKNIFINVNERSVILNFQWRLSYDRSRCIDDFITNEV